MSSGGMKSGQGKEENPVNFKCSKCTHFNQNCQYYVVRTTEKKMLDAYHKVTSGYSQSINWVCGRTTNERNFPDRLKMAKKGIKGLEDKRWVV